MQRSEGSDLKMMPLGRKSFDSGLNGILICGAQDSDSKGGIINSGDSNVDLALTFCSN